MLFVLCTTESPYHYNMSQTLMDITPISYKTLPTYLHFIIYSDVGQVCGYQIRHIYQSYFSHVKKLGSYLHMSGKLIYLLINISLRTMVP